MLKRLYVHNFRCLENFEFAPGELPSILLLGRNGSGKSTIGLALELLQNIARGTNRVGELIKPKDITAGRTQVPMRFEVEVVLERRVYVYTLALEFPLGFRELRVFEERLTVDGNPIYTRELAQVRLARTGLSTEAAFRIDWHLVALPIVQEANDSDPLHIIKDWLSKILIVKPIPTLMRGDSDQSGSVSGVFDRHSQNVGAWFYTMMATAPSTYADISSYLNQVMPDLKDITNPSSGKDSHRLLFRFSKIDRKLELGIEDLSDGEKCFFVFALVIANNLAFGPVLCFWDEPDNFLAPDEIGHSVMALRRAFQKGGQLIVTSHNPEAVRRFSDENTLYLSRRSHLEPTTIASVADVRASGQFEGGFVDALIRGDIES